MEDHRRHLEPSLGRLVVRRGRVHRIIHLRGGRAGQDADAGHYVVPGHGHLLVRHRVVDLNLAGGVLVQSDHLGPDLDMGHGIASRPFGYADHGACVVAEAKLALGGNTHKDGAQLVNVDRLGGGAGRHGDPLLPLLGGGPGGGGGVVVVVVVIAGIVVVVAVMLGCARRGLMG